MAKTGLKHPVCAIYSEITGSPVYTSGVIIGKAIKSNLKWNKNDVKLNADDNVAERDNSVIGGTLTVSTDDLSYAVRAMLFGHTYSNGKLVVSENDVAPYVGYGVYGKTVRDGVIKWRATFVPKVMFGVPDDETETRGEKTQFQTPTIEGEVMKDINGQFFYEELFDTEAEAIAYLDGLVGITPQLDKPASSKPTGTYSGTQSITLTALTGADIYYTTNGTTPSATNGTKYSAAVSVANSCALRAVAIKSGYSNSEIATYEYIITA